MQLRDTIPCRRQRPVKTKYTEYRADLRTDFNGRCGYCDDSDARTDSICFHIDHFAPKSKFSELETEYSNLVYACRFCNVRKSDHWIGTDFNQPNDGNRGFVDPCGVEYDTHLGRSSEGAIVPKTPLGRYIYQRLGLHLLRHEILWEARQLKKLRDEAQILVVQYRQSGLPKSKVYLDLVDRFLDLTLEIEKYEELTRGR